MKYNQHPPVGGVFFTLFGVAENGTPTPIYLAALGGSTGILAWGANITVYYQVFVMVGSTPPVPPVTYQQQDVFMFRFGNPELHLCLPRLHPRLVDPTSMVFFQQSVNDFTEDFTFRYTRGGSLSREMGWKVVLLEGHRYRSPLKI